MFLLPTLVAVLSSVTITSTRQLPAPDHTTVTVTVTVTAIPTCSITTTPNLSTPLAVNTCPSSVPHTATHSLAPIDVDIFWDNCCNGPPTHLTASSTSLTTSDIPYPTSATRSSIHINALPEDCLLNLYGSDGGWGYSPGATYSPGAGVPGTCVPYPWYWVDPTWNVDWVARMINVTCGPGVVSQYREDLALGLTS